MQTKCNKRYHPKELFQKFTTLLTFNVIRDFCLRLRIIMIRNFSEHFSGVEKIQQSNSFKLSVFNLSEKIFRSINCVKYARIRVFSDQYFPVKEQNWKFCAYMGKYGSEKTHILPYFTQWYAAIVQIADFPPIDVVYHRLLYLPSQLEPS